jgi:hypothetical protein
LRLRGGGIDYILRGGIGCGIGRIHLASYRLEFLGISVALHICRRRNLGAGGGRS